MYRDTMTVQAPQPPSPQPSLVPVRPMNSIGGLMRWRVGVRVCRMYAARCVFVGTTCVREHKTKRHKHALTFAAQPSEQRRIRVGRDVSVLLSVHPYCQGFGIALEGIHGAEPFRVVVTCEGRGFVRQCGTRGPNRTGVRSQEFCRYFSATPA